MINSRRLAPWVVIVLAACGAAALAARLYSRYSVQMVQGDSVWRVTYDLTFHAKKAGITVRAAVPRDTPHARVFRQELRYSGLSTERLRPSRNDTREVSVGTMRSGDFHLAARFDIHLRRHTEFGPTPTNVTLTADERAHYLRATRTLPVDHPLVTAAVQELGGDPANKAALMKRLFDFCHNEIATVRTENANDAAATLERRKGTLLGRARALVTLARAAKIPARLIAGFELRQETSVAHPIVWVEALTDHRWDAYDPENGYAPTGEAASSLPYNYVAARYDGFEIIRGPDVTFLRPPQFSIVRLPPPGGILGRRSRRPIDILDLTRLPLEMHEVLSVMLLIPLGALVTAMFRTLVGMRTFGTFTPTLLALSFVYSDWRTGLFVFVTVVVLGLAVRTLIDKLKLLMVPRLSAILTLVVLCIVFSVSLLEYFRLTPSAQAVLLPMVIVTSTIERFFVTTEEDGVRFALQLMGSTVVLAFCCYLVLRWETVGRWLLIYPESHFFTVAFLLLIGRYTGYRLTELWRFRDFGKTA
jgi:transglutaminase-like putative cysteine protease